MSKEARSRDQDHGGDLYGRADLLDFSVSLNPMGIRPQIRSAYEKNLAHLDRYPDPKCRELTCALAAFEQVGAEQILCGNGAAELIYAVAAALQPRKALVLAPSFSEYARALTVAGSAIIDVPLSKETGFALTDAVLDFLTPAVDLVYLANPNNPTGALIPRPLLQKIVTVCEENRTVVVLDECFLPLIQAPEAQEMTGDLDAYPHLLILKALTKTFAIPGLRLGYLLSGNWELLNRIRGMMQPWNVSGPAQACGVAAVTDAGSYLEASRDLIRTEKKVLTDTLTAQGYPVYGSAANFVFFEGKPGLYETALQAGFLIRDCSNFRGLAGGSYDRIGLRSPKENERIEAWLRQS